MRRFRFGSACLLILFFMGGCCLPQGVPPAGAIVDNPRPDGCRKIEILPQREAEEYFITGLLNAVLIHCSGEKLRIDADPATADSAGYIVRKCGEISGVSAAVTGNDAFPRLISGVLPGRLWQMSLVLSGGKTVWSDAVQLK